ncbi:hypothetical protein HRbin22_00329 [Candidatus Thermoflexus japonica]|uniref:Uncharacterized protein n=1 Tax=Candidatus Thermoflexus japonica TaxID=2035417 RepID=A0A2H5Y3U6_9CHLR|nr:hypothetical protein HRbin22_00329 [Candidatus Thermoflexus japonica]
MPRHRSKSGGDGWSIVWKLEFHQLGTALKAVATPDGGFLLVGWTNGFGVGDIHAVKIDASGTSGYHETTPPTQTSALCPLFSLYLPLVCRSFQP